MVVVGGYDPETGLVSHNWADYVRVAAPAVSINVAAFYTDGELAVQLLGYIPQPTELQRKLQLETSEGTSFACPIVTGVIATLIGAGVPIAEVVPYLYNQAYPRVKGGPNAVYNGIEIKQWPQSLWPRWYLESLVTRTEPVKTILRDGTPLKTKYTTYLGEKSSTGTKTISVGGSAPKTLYTHFKRGTPSTSAPPLTR
ncbi:uncharacterized protein DFL_009878 [Arthrobotrys flagrans]|nr:hypothetical protein DFL_009878 [Arthrobotrys flagrans]